MKEMAPMRLLQSTPLLLLFASAVLSLVVVLEAAP
jgi:hypothetical protein